MAVAPRLAVVSSEIARELDMDLDAVITAATRAGCTTEVVDWHDDSADWGSFDLALVRSPWDYVFRHDEFISWAERVGSVTTLVNSAAVLRWNTDKRYMRDLADAGVPIVPSTFWATGEAPPPWPEVGEFVVKPTVSGGSKDTARFDATSAADLARAEGLVERIHGTGRTAMVQPYLDAVDRDGEAALVFFGGEFSHALTKGQMLRPGVDPTGELFQAERIDPRDAAPGEIEFGARVLDAVRSMPADLELGTASLPYARLDLLRDDDGGLRLLELEATEPSFFFDTVPDAATAAAAADRLIRAALAVLS